MKSPLKRNLSFLTLRPSTSSAGASLSSEPLPGRMYAVALAIALVAMSCGIALHIRNFYQESIAEWAATDANIALEQTTMLANWAREREGDVSVLSQREMVYDALAHFNARAGDGRGSTSNGIEYSRSLDEVKTAYSYDSAYVLDRDGHVVAHSTGAADPAPELIAACRESINAGKLQIAVSGVGPKDALIGFATPIWPHENESAAGSEVGAVLLVARAAQTVYSLIEHSGIPNRSGETFLIRREGDTVVYLSPLRFEPNREVFLRVPVSRAPLSVRGAITGKHSFLESADYRGVPVVATIQFIPILNWGLVRKIDRSEALTSFYRQATLETVSGGLFMVLVAGIGLFLRRRVIMQVIREEGQKFRLLFETAPDAVYLVEPGTLRILSRNRRAKKMDRLSDEEAARTVFPDFYCAGDREEMRRLLSSPSGQANRKMLRATGHHFERNGELVPVEEAASLVDTGREQFILAIVHDISERKRAEEAISHMALIVQTSNDAIIGCSLDGTVQSWNSGAERVYGYTASEAIGQSIIRTVPPAGVEEARAVRAAIQRGERVEHYRMIRVHKSGAEIHMSVTVSPLQNAEGVVTGVSLIERDITEQKKAEAEIRELNQNLEQRVAQRTEELLLANRELEAFTYSVSHDLRAPLRHVDGFSKLLADLHAPELPPDANEYIGQIRESVQHMGMLIDDLLNLARVGRKQIDTQVTDLTGLVEEVVADLKRANPGRRLDWRVHDLPSVKCDRSLMKQVFANLLSNSVKYTRPREVAVIEVGASRKDDATAIFVRDNGVGFNPKYADKLFGVFQRLHRSDEFEGTGVGLAIAQRIVQKHGGHIWAEAALDRGATFYFTLAAGHSA